MPTEVLTQLRALRESIADSLRKDPRYLTLTAIDKSIAEITGVLTASGHLPHEPESRAPLRFETPAGQHSASAGSPALSQISPSPDAPEPPARNLSAAAAPRVADLPVSAASALAAAGLAARTVPAPDETHDVPVHEDAAHHEDPPAPEIVHHEPGEEPVHVPHEASTGEDALLDSKSSGYVPMRSREGAPQYQPAISVRYGKLPNKVDLRPMMSPVEHQGETSSCVANAVASAYEYLLKKATKRDQNLSRLFVYYNARWRDGAQAIDAGSAIQLAMESFCTFGACNEALWPFDPRLVTEKPGADAYREAQPLRAQGLAQVPMKLDAWKQALAEGRPIVFGLTLFDSFYACTDRGGVVEMPAPDELAHLGHGGHAMCAVGYSETERVFIVRNCWGVDWGDQGYCYIPFAYLLNPKFSEGDAWTLFSKAPMQPPREAWSDDHTPVTNGGKGVHVPIEPYKIEDYAHAAFDADRERRSYNGAIADDFARYASLADEGKWDEMEQRDARTVLTSASALSAIAAEFASGGSDHDANKPLDGSDDRATH